MAKLLAILALLTSVCAGQQCVVRGRIVGREGSPFPRSFVRADNNGGLDSSAVQADARGYFTIALPAGEPKNLYLGIAGRGFGGMLPILTDAGDSVFFEARLDSAHSPVLDFSPPEARIAKFARVHTALTGQYLDFVRDLQTLQRNDGDAKSYLAAWMDSAALLKHFAASEEDPVLRGEYLLRYYRLTSIRGMTFDTAFFRTNVRSIPARSPLWFFNNYEAADQHLLRPDGRRFVDSVMEFHPSRELRAFLLFNAAVEAQRAMNETDVRRNYRRLKEDYGDIWWSKIADQWIIVDAKVRTGVQVPDFAFKDLDDSTVLYSRSSLKGKVYLLDFWATWCLPCIGEIPYLRKAYEKYHSRGFEIISISSDARRSDVESFRRGNGGMPWRHVWVTGEDLRRCHDQFEVTGIPKPILVGRDGTVIGLKSDVRGENLAKMLDGLMGR